MTPEERNRMVEDNMGLAVHFAQRYAGSMDFDDLLQEAALGLIDAVDAFDEARGVKLSTYAWWHIRKRIREALDLRNDMIRTPRRHKQSPKCLSLDYEYEHDRTMLDHLEGPAPEPWQELEHQDELEAIRRLVDELQERDAKVLRMRYGIECERMTLKQVAKVIDVTPERVRQIQRRAEEKLLVLARRCDTLN